MRHIEKLCSILILSVFLICCSDKKPSPESVAHELREEGQSELEDAPELELLAQGKKYFNSGMYSLARSSFESLRASYPLSPYIEFVELKIADTDFELNKFTEAAIAYEDFARRRPSSEASAYALFMAARSNELSNSGIGRDFAPLEKAQGFYQRVLSEHPNSPYAASARKFLAAVTSALKEYDLSVIAFYRAKGNMKAAEARQAEFEKKWKDLTPEQPDDEGKLLAKINSEQMDSLSTSAQSESPKIVNARLAREVAEEEMALEATTPQTTISPTERDNQVSVVERVECLDDQPKRIVVYLNEELEDDWTKLSKPRYDDKKGMIILELPQSNGREIKQPCLSQELKVTRGGELTLKSPSPASMISLNHPARLLLVLYDS